MNADTEGDWELVDGRLPRQNRDADFPKKLIGDAGALGVELQRCAHENPGMYYLVSPGGNALGLGIGNSFGFVKCLIADSPFYGKYVCADAEQAANCVELMSEGLDEPFWPRNLLRTDQIIDIAAHFFETERLPAGVEWGSRALQ